MGQFSWQPYPIYHRSALGNCTWTPGLRACIHLGGDGERFGGGGVAVIGIQGEKRGEGHDHKRMGTTDTNTKPRGGGRLSDTLWMELVLEGVSTGMPMVTWLIFADQSFNKKLVVDVLEIGVRVGARIAGEEEEEEVVKSEKIERAVDWVMGSGEAADRRRTRVRRLGEVARRAMEEGGSSYKDMGRLMEELMLAPKWKSE